MSSATSTLTPFAQAVQEFVVEIERESDRNNPFYQDLLVNVTSGRTGQYSGEEAEAWCNKLDASIKEIQAARNKRKSQQVIRCIGEAAKGINRYAQSFDVLIQAGPTAAVLVYGGARLVLTLCEGIHDCYKIIASAFEAIRDYIHDFHVRARAFSRSRKVQEQLVRSFKTIINFWLRASQLLRSNAAKIIFSSRHSQLSNCWSEFRRELTENLERVKTASEIAGLEQDELRSIAQWIRGPKPDKFDVQRQLRINYEKRHQSSCEWITEHAVFKQWLVSNANRSLLLFSPPGSGKTILSSFVAHEIMERKFGGLKCQKVVYYCFSFNDMEQNDSMTALRSIATQLLAIHTRDNLQVPDAVHKLFVSDDRVLADGLRDSDKAISVIRELLMVINRVHIVIDGLDECRDRKTLHSRLLSLLQIKPLGIVKWFLTSRPDLDLRGIVGSQVDHILDVNKEDLSGDVRTYMSDKLQSELGMDCKDCIDLWINKSDSNFLWADCTLRILKQQGYTSEASVEKALQEFPRGLEGCYERSLLQIKRRHSPDEVYLAKIVFQTMTAALQPLRLSEILDMIAIRTASDRETKDWNSFKKWRPFRKSIEEICTGLIVFQSAGGGNASDPTLLFVHKSVFDFFLEGPHSPRVSNEVTEFFTTKEQAQLELGNVCLQYLSCVRYKGLTAVKPLLSDPEHTLLPHAATFWHQYLNEVSPTPDLRRRVLNFVDDTCFWTCVATQAYIVPHFFGRYHEGQSGGFNLQAGTEAALKDVESASFADLLPLWLDEDEAGLELVQWLQAFVAEWHPVLNSNPSAIRDCIMCSQMEERMGSREDWRRGQVSVWSLGAEPSHEAKNNLNQYAQVLTVVTNERNTPTVLLRRQMYSEGSIHLTHEWVTLSQHEHCSQADIGKYRISAESGSLCYFSDLESGSLCPLSIDRLSLDVERLSKEGDDNEADDDVRFQPPTQLEGTWSLRNSIRAGLANDSVKTPSFAIAAFFALEPQAGYERKDTTKNSDSDLDDKETSSDGDSDKDSAIDMASMTSEGGMSLPNCCMVVIPAVGRPLWSAWRSTNLQENVVSAFHPIQPIVVWSSQRSVAQVANLISGNMRSVDLKEPVGTALLKSAGVHKEFHYLPDGRLIYVSCIASETESGIRHLLSVCDCDLSFDKNVPVLATKNYATIEHYGSGPLCSPLILTAWTSTHVYISLPPLSFKPKLVRFDLSQVHTDSPPTVETLCDPIYWPSSTTTRAPKLYIFDRPNGSQHLLLTRDSPDSQDPSGQPSPVPTSTTTLPSNTYATALLMPSVMSWELDRETSWRAWDGVLDQESPEYRSSNETYQRLRGTFVAADKRFSVAVRSRLDWRKKATLSCI